MRKEVLTLNNQVQALNDENNQLRKMLQQEQTKSSQHYPVYLEDEGLPYAKFISKIQCLEQEIDELHLREQVKNGPQLGSPLNQITSLFDACQKKEQEIILR
jgi:protein-tyrosine phosphatase